MHRKIIGILLILLAASVVTGCFKEKDPVGSISGTLRYKGEIVHEGQVSFRNLERGKGAGSMIGEDGNYNIVTIPTGEFEVVVLPPDPGEPDSPRARNPQKYVVPSKYHRFETSGLSFTVQEGKNTFDIDLE